MANVIVYLLRHGETDSDTNNEFCGWTDEDMNALGMAAISQAMDEVVSKLTFGAVYSDDLQRTIHAAEEAVKYSQTTKDVIENPMARTWGIGGFLTQKEKTPENIATKKYYVDNPDLMPPGGNAETLNDSKRRWLSFLTWVVSVTPANMPSLVACHSSNIKTTGQAYGERLKLKPSGIAKMTVTSNGIEFEILREGAASVVDPDDKILDQGQIEHISSLGKLDKEHIEDVRCARSRSGRPRLLRYSPDQAREPNGEWGSGGTTTAYGTKGSSNVVTDTSAPIPHEIGGKAMFGLVKVGDKLTTADGTKYTVKGKKENTLEVFDHKAGEYKIVTKTEVGDLKWGSRAKVLRYQPVTPVPRQYGSIQYDLNLADRSSILSFPIQHDDLAEEGRETYPHVTVLWGLDPSVTSAQINNITASIGTCEVTWDEVEIFPEGPDGVPLVLKLHGESLMALNQALRALPHTETFPEYVPHATIAYLKSVEVAQKYLGEYADLTGDTSLLNDLVYSPTTNIVEKLMRYSPDQPRTPDGKFGEEDSTTHTVEVHPDSFIAKASSPESHVNKNTVDKYREQIKSGAGIPNLKLGLDAMGNVTSADGRHRAAAALAEGKKVLVDVTVSSS